MASSINNPMPQTVEGYKELAQRDLVLIEKQRDEIGRLKAKINQLQQKLKKEPKFVNTQELIDRLPGESNE